MIHPTAIIDAEAEIAGSATVGPGAIVEGGVRIGPHCTIGPYALIQRGTGIDEGVTIGAHAVIGTLPQDLRFDPAAPSGVRIGPGACIREHVTISRSHEMGGFTLIGAKAFLMTGAHVGHGSTVGDHAVLANLVMLAGHVSVGAHAFLGGGAGIHQFVRIGESAMVSGLARITRDVPPFLTISERDEVNGLNLVGLKRRGFPREALRELKEAFGIVYRRRGGQRTRAQSLLETAPPASPQALSFLAFFAGGTRGFAQFSGVNDRRSREPSVEPA